MGDTAGFCSLKARFIPLGIHFAGHRKRVEFGFVRFGKGEIFWMKTLKRFQRNGTIAQLSNLQRQSFQVYPFVCDV